MEEVRDTDLDYVNILKGLQELPFQVGKNLLCDFLLGSYSNKSVTKNRLDELHNFGSLYWEKSKVFAEIERLIANGMIELVPSDYNKFVKVLSLTLKGKNEIVHPTLSSRKLSNRVDFKETVISDDDRVRFSALDNFLDGFNDFQKKAIISDSKNLLCVAGAGSGKTTVLTRRVEFLVKYRGVDPSKILAVTFTRKARDEMLIRLGELGVRGVFVHTFNSFCEMVLRRNETEVYGRQIRVLSYQDKILAMNLALASLGLDLDDVIKDYFSVSIRKVKTASQLMNSFMNDCFSVMDYFKVTGDDVYDFSRDAGLNNKVNAERVYRIIKFLKDHMETQGLRDFTDQVIDTIKFFRKYPSKVPKFSHVLVDEYQDVNSMQIELIELLGAKNLFAVGDPRQSIFGWRGSDVNYILNFEKSHGDAEVVHLTRNYRSSKRIVDFMNCSIKEMGLPDLEHCNVFENSNVKVLDFENEKSEISFVLQNILNDDVPREEVFVLARTNRQLMDISLMFKQAGIVHSVKTDEVKRPVDFKVGEVTLATVHAIKGLEARKVFLVGANDQNFPCKASDHPAIEMVKSDDYDKEEEERRLFYVAISRAKEKLFVTYSGKKPSYFLTDEMMGLIGRGVSGSSKQSTLDGEVEGDVVVNDDLFEELRSWRSAVAEERNVPAYVVLSNKTLEEISVKCPKSADELSKISGIGPAKLVDFGGRILEIVEEVNGRG